MLRHLLAEKLSAPGICHTRIIATKTWDHQLELRGIPEVFVRLALLQLFLGVQPLPLVVRVGFERLARPIRSSGEVVIVGWSPKNPNLEETIEKPTNHTSSFYHCF